MAVPGQRFELDLDSDDFSIKPTNGDVGQNAFGIKEIREHQTADTPPPPTLKPSNSGFPAHKSRPHASAFKQRQNADNTEDPGQNNATRYQPSDRAIRQQIGEKYGVDFEAQQKAEINEDNKRRLADMSEKDIEEARSEILGSLSPEFMERLLKRSNLDDEPVQTSSREVEGGNTARVAAEDPAYETDHVADEAVEQESPPPPHDTSLLEGSSLHFPVPPRSASSYKPLDPNSKTFQNDLRSTYFPELAHDPSSLSWLQDPTPEDDRHSSYNPNLTSYPASSLRFDFNGRIVPPQESLEIPVSVGLHHHGDAPSSAGYTVPELTMLARSIMPNQRCIAYQTVGRILYRLGQGEFGQRASELEEAVWDIFEHERILELVMAEANKQGGHVSANAYATEALWLWRKGGGSDRGLLNPGEKRAK